MNEERPRIINTLLLRIQSGRHKSDQIFKIQWIYYRESVTWVFVGLEHKKVTLRKYQNSNSGSSYHSWDHETEGESLQISEPRRVEKRPQRAEMQTWGEDASLLMLLPCMARKGPWGTGAQTGTTQAAWWGSLWRCWKKVEVGANATVGGKLTETAKPGGRFLLSSLLPTFLWDFWFAETHRNITATKILFTEIESYINLILPPSPCSLFYFFLLSQITLKVEKWYFPHFSFILLSDCEGIKRHIGQKFSFNYRNTSLLRFHLSCPHSQKIWVNHKWIQAGRLYFEVHLYFPKVRGWGVFHCDILGIWSDEIKDIKNSCDHRGICWVLLKWFSLLPIT